jgi:hypothetical protein
MQRQIRDAPHAPPHAFLRPCARRAQRQAISWCNAVASFSGKFDRVAIELRLSSNEFTRPSVRSFIQERARAMAVSKMSLVAGSAHKKTNAQGVARARDELRDFSSARGAG